MSLLNQPLLLEPNNYTFNMWGGSWIPEWKNTPAPTQPVGESWEFSAHPKHPSQIRLSGGTLQSVLDIAKDLSTGPIPFLLKVIDSRDDLSLQVHPSEEQARKMENDNGKSEAWYILETGSNQDDGFIYLGFDPRCVAQYASPIEFQEAFLGAIQQANSYGPLLDTTERERAARLVLPFLNRIQVKTGEAYRVSPGTIHSIGRGVRLFEIQETSDVTYRVWDWNRPDADKLKKQKLEFRSLHLDQAKKVLSFRGEEPENLRIIPHTLSPRETRIVDEENGKFSAHIIRLKRNESAFAIHSENRFYVLTCVQGRVGLSFALTPGAERKDWGVLNQGRTVVIPASLSSVHLTSDSDHSQIIKSY